MPDKSKQKDPLIVIGSVGCVYLHINLNILLPVKQLVITILRRHITQCDTFSRQGSRRIYGGRRKSSTMTFTLPDLPNGKGILRRHGPYYADCSVSYNGIMSKVTNDAFQMAPLAEEKGYRDVDEGYV